MKAIEAINVIIVLVLGILTLIAVLGLFMGVWTPARGGTSLQVATQSVCKKINPGMCAIKQVEGICVDDFDVDGDGEMNRDDCLGGVGNWNGNDDNLWRLCTLKYGICTNWDPADASCGNVGRKKCLIDICGCSSVWEGP